MPDDAPPPLDQTTRVALDEIATEQWSVEPYTRDEIATHIMSGPHRILRNVNLEDDEMHAVAALPDVIRRWKQAEQERDTLAAQVQGLREALEEMNMSKQGKPMREWNELYPKEVELFSRVVNERNSALAEIERLRECLGWFATPDRWRETNDTNSDGWTIRVWAWSTMDIPWQTAQQMLEEDVAAALGAAGETPQ